MTNKPPDVEKSLCFTCKYGFCVKQIDEGELVPIPKKQEEWENPVPIEAEHDHAVLQGNGIFALCFWPTQVMKHEMPVQVGFVEKCNRYEKNPTKKGLTSAEPVV